MTILAADESPTNINPLAKLEKSIGFWGLLAMSVGINIGGALFALTSLAGSHSGPSLPIAMLISAIPVILALAPFGILSIAYPTTSASYRYGQLVSPSIALVYLLTSVICIGIGGLPLFALIAGIGLEPILSVSPTTIGVAILSFFYVINLIGVDVTARIQMMLTLILVLALLLFIVMGAPHISLDNFTPMFPNGIGGTLVAAGLMFTFCAGGLFVIDLGDEIVSAEKNLPMAITLGMLVALFIYIGIMIVTVGAVDWVSFDGQSLVTIAQNFMSGNSLLFFVIGGAVLAAATTINTVFAVQARLILVVAEEGLISPRFGKISARFGTPYWALTLIYLTSVTALLLIPSIKLFGSLLNFTMILAVSLVTLAALKVTKEYPELCRNKAFSIAPATLKKICITILSLNGLIAAFFAIRIGWGSVLFIGIMLAVFIYSRIHQDKLQTIKANTLKKWTSL